MLTVAILDSNDFSAVILESFVNSTFERILRVVTTTDKVGVFQFNVLSKKPDILLIDADAIYDDSVCLISDIFEGYKSRDILPLVIIVFKKESALKRGCILKLLDKTKKIRFIYKPISSTEFACCIMENCEMKLKR